MFSDFAIWGLSAHLVLQDKDGAFEVSCPFKRHKDGTVAIDADRVLAAIHERGERREPLQRAVTFHDVADRR